MSTIPNEITIPLPDFHRRALKSLLQSAPAGCQLSDLLELVLARGLMTMLVGQELPEVHRQAVEKGEALVPERQPFSDAPRVAVDFMAFPIDLAQESALDGLLWAYPHLGEEEICRILIDLGLRAVQDDPFAQQLLAHTRPDTTLSDEGA